MDKRTCSQCGTSIEGLPPQSRYCTVQCREAAKWARKPRSACVYCGESTGWAVDDPRAEGVSHPRCRPGYRSNVRERKSGFDSWVCQRCGEVAVRPHARGQRPKWCPACRSKRGAGCFVTPTVRREIYERDAWECGLCGDPVDEGLVGSRDPWRPSLDHIVPRSHGGPDSPDNLRLAHLWCNIARGAGVNDDLFEEVV